jgi:hypothetical protein
MAVLTPGAMLIWGAGRVHEWGCRVVCVCTHRGMHVPANALERFYEALFSLPCRAWDCLVDSRSCLKRKSWFLPAEIY